jgi:hypothetical protein
MFKNLGDLDDKTAAGIVKAADRGEVSSGGSYGNVVREARELVDTDRGDCIYTGSIGNSPQWRRPNEG